MRITVDVACGLWPVDVRASSEATDEADWVATCRKPGCDWAKAWPQADDTLPLHGPEVGYVVNAATEHSRSHEVRDDA